ncbi:hypothetical protein Ga0074812_11329 [Parafrankia irregularis]|uniref:Uncharacterized protein n=1 Tax=Parafrankia irregularis TaxID=795642 RepID=A0A0S4QPC0_9ACTN|nr:hypothetical protein Ga0074812_11329 [Parafrankia irregularis]
MATPSARSRTGVFAHAECSCLPMAPKRATRRGRQCGPRRAAQPAMVRERSPRATTSSSRHGGWFGVTCVVTRHRCRNHRRHRWPGGVLAAAKRPSRRTAGRRTTVSSDQRCHPAAVPTAGYPRCIHEQCAFSISRDPWVSVAIARRGGAARLRVRGAENSACPSHQNPQALPDSKPRVGTARDHESEEPRILVVPATGIPRSCPTANHGSGRGGTTKGLSSSSSDRGVISAYAPGGQPTARCTRTRSARSGETTASSSRTRPAAGAARPS